MTPLCQKIGSAECPLLNVKIFKIRNFTEKVLFFLSVRDLKPLRVVRYLMIKQFIKTLLSKKFQIVEFGQIPY